MTHWRGWAAGRGWRTLPAAMLGAARDGCGGAVPGHRDLAEYEAMALVATMPELAGYRERLRTNRATHPLVAKIRFTRGLEDTLASVAGLCYPNIVGLEEPAGVHARRRRRTSGLAGPGFGRQAIAATRARRSGAMPARHSRCDHGQSAPERRAATACPRSAGRACTSRAA